MDKRPLLESDSLEKTQEMSTALTRDDTNVNSGASYVSLTPAEDKKGKNQRKTWTGRLRYQKTQDSRHTHKRSPRPSQNNIQRITLYSHREDGRAEIEVLEVPTRSSSLDSRQEREIEEEGSSGGIIEGQFTTSFIESEGENEYDNLTGLASFGWDEPATTNALDLCKKYVLGPYHFFLKVIGWRTFRSRYDHTSLYKKICNVVYPVFIFLMLIFACGSQITTCFSRSRSRPPIPRGNFSILDCDKHIVSTDVVSYVLILGSYLGGLLIFRFLEPEHLSSLSETVFLSYNYTSVNKSRKKPVFILLTFLVSGVIWFIASFATSVLRIFVLQLDQKTLIIQWFTNNITADDQWNQLKISKDIYEGLHYAFVCTSMFGFIFFDLLYIAVVINYVSQCQLLSFYIENVTDKVENKRYKTLTDASKEIYRIYEFLKVLNGRLSFVMTLIIFIFVGNVIYSYLDLSKTGSGHIQSIVLGFLNVIVWLVALAFPIIMATILTSKGKSIRRLGLEIASRPYVFSDTPDLELEIFLNYTNATRYTAKIALVPMYPSLVAGGTFIGLLFVTLRIIIPPVMSVSWF